MYGAVSVLVKGSPVVVVRTVVICGVVAVVTGCSFFIISTDVTGSVMTVVAGRSVAAG